MLLTFCRARANILDMKTLISSSLVVFAAALLSACANPVTITSDNVEPYEKEFPHGIIVNPNGGAVASFIQWNDDYAVTARHVIDVQNVVHVCSTGCDLQFFAHRAGNIYRPWRDQKEGEASVLMGINARGVTVVTTGEILSGHEFIKGQPDRYSITTAPSIPGMSGGPVYGRDSSVIGMTIGNYKEAVGRRTLFLPFEVIEREWKLFSVAKD